MTKETKNLALVAINLEIHRMKSMEREAFQEIIEEYEKAVRELEKMEEI